MQLQNYILLVNFFWRSDTEHHFDGNATRLYFFLLDFCNKLFWKNPFYHSDRFVAAAIGVSVNTMKHARRLLQDASLIRFTPGGKGPKNMGGYFIIAPKKVSKNDTSSETSDDASSDIPTDTNKKTKTKTKTNDSSFAMASPSPSVPKEKSGKKELEIEPHWPALIKVWMDFNFEKFDAEPSFSGADPRHLKEIIIRLRKRAQKAGYVWTEDTATNSLKLFFSACFLDRFLSQNFLLSNLMKQFDKIILNHAKNEASTNSSVKGSARNRGTAQLLGLIKHNQPGQM